MTDIAKAFTKIFWGFMLVFLNLNINQFDLFPDFIGYFIIVSGLSDLSTFSSYFKKANIYAILLGVASIPTYFIGEINILEGFIPSTSTILILASSSIMTLIHLVLIYYLLKGSIELANQHKQESLANTTKNNLKIYVIVVLSVAILTPFALNISEGAALTLITIGAIASFVVEIMILILIWQYRKIFNNIQA
ncbi:hypothetical protein KHA93_00155 [Bacillus sp. FJAT-49732]|uniref:Uncharacterized protein n=1 Tax=Lederbergia citrisecunda TaxID=2833583 RepID=A0A942THB9_9BACI|nr:hypothetical protein [Lederbergia citrisecunda]MBS4198071.1 hypothetical protein [Lederbergia citrisecunda]